MNVNTSVGTRHQNQIKTVQQHPRLGLLTEYFEETLLHLQQMVAGLNGTGGGV